MPWNSLTQACIRLNTTWTPHEIRTRSCAPSRREISLSALERKASHAVARGLAPARSEYSEPRSGGVDDRVHAGHAEETSRPPGTREPANEEDDPRGDCGRRRGSPDGADRAAPPGPDARGRGVRAARRPGSDQ